MPAMRSFGTAAAKKSIGNVRAIGSTGRYSSSRCADSVISTTATGSVGRGSSDVPRGTADASATSIIGVTGAGACRSSTILGGSTRFGRSAAIGGVIGAGGATAFGGSAALGGSIGPMAADKSSAPNAKSSSATGAGAAAGSGTSTSWMPISRASSRCSS
jgi:hypothetical protein